ncbi:MAG: hypothetical protein EP329_20220 [Deltaproteobacteria bacterium]|nr:MAG: hypothetical protein EP329_20220 [Deltaproteobacteria bacterium]
MRSPWKLLLPLVAFVSTCVPAEGPRGPEGALSLSMAALTLNDVGDVVWDIEVLNGADPAEIVWQRRVASSRYGDGGGSASYVGTCDAGPGADLNVVRVWVVGVYSAAVDAPGAFAAGATTGAGTVVGTAVDFESPTAVAPLSREVACVANSDVQVTFDVALMRPAQQGFFDIAVSFGDIFCSAKFDCCSDPAAATCATDGSEDIALLFDAGGARASTMVLGFACTAGVGSGVETQLYLDDLALDCTTPAADTFTADIVLDPSGAPGNQCVPGPDGMSQCPAIGEPGALDADAYLYQLAVYRGLEPLTSAGDDTNKVYWNVALGVKRPAIGGCWLSTRGTADDPNATPGVDQGRVQAGVVYPYVRWLVRLDDCGQEALRFGDATAQVRADYTTTADALDTVFANGYGPGLDGMAFCDPVCAVTEVCEDGLCVPISGALAIAPSTLDLLVSTSYAFAAGGGTPPYTYALIAGGGTLVGSLYTAPATAGSATVRVSDSAGGTSDAVINVYEALTISPTTPSLAVGADLTFSASGGVGAYTFSVVSGGGSFVGATYTAPGTAGSVTVQVSDEGGHTASTTVTVFEPLTLTPSPAYVTLGGQLVFGASGGTAPYTFSLEAGGGSLAGATYTAPGTAGTATVRVTDSVGATADALVNITPFLGIDPAVVWVEPGQVVTFSGTDGAGGYSYSLLSGGGTLVSDTLTAPASGAVVVQVVDAAGASAKATVKVKAYPRMDALGVVAASDVAFAQQTCTVRPDRTLWCWGANESGQHGTGTTDPTFDAVQVGTASDWVMASVGNSDINSGSYMCGLRDGGTAWCWGDNTYGELGDGTTVSTTAPGQVGTDTDWAEISAGERHTCAIKTDGTLWCWGYNLNGELGVGDTLPHRSPTQVGTEASWRAIAVGVSTCALKADDTLWCWGLNSTWQLGIGSTTSQTSPVEVGAGASWATVARPLWHTCATRHDGTLWCWGKGTYGALGNGSTANRTTPGQEVTLGTDWVSVTTGGTANAATSCGTRTDGTLWCWGADDWGQMADNRYVAVATAVQSTPLQIGVDTDWASVSAAAQHVCGSRDDGSQWCWGRNTQGPLGSGGAANKTTPLALAGSWAAVDTAVSGTSFACGLDTGGALTCWGANDKGQLGTGVTTLPFGSLPAAVVGGPASWTALAIGGSHACGLGTGDTLWCWGANDQYQLGDGTTTTATTPIQVAGSWVAAASGGKHVCARKADASLWCWGDNNSGQVGNATTTDVTTPTQIAAGTTWGAFDLNASHTCAIRSDATLWCWGYNWDGMLGDGTTTARSVPTREATSATDWTAVATGGWNTCGLRGTGTLWCWGDNTYGTLGLGSGTSWALSPTRVGTQADWSDVSCGGQACCGVRSGELWCWGRNMFGEVGDGSGAVVYTPTRIGSASDWLWVRAGTGTACGRQAGSGVSCWGADSLGTVSAKGGIRRPYETQVELP